MMDWIEKFPRLSRPLSLILILLILGLSPQPVLSVCLEADGQINVEVACDSDLGNAGTHRAPANKSVLHGVSPGETDPCVDIPLWIHSELSFISKSGNTIGYPSPGPLDPGAQINVGKPLAAVPVLTVKSTTGLSPLRSLRTIILLI